MSLLKEPALLANNLAGFGGALEELRELGAGVLGLLGIRFVELHVVGLVRQGIFRRGPTEAHEAGKAKHQIDMLGQESLGNWISRIATSEGIVLDDQALGKLPDLQGMVTGNLGANTGRRDNGIC